MSINVFIILFFFLFISIGLYGVENKESETAELKIEAIKNQTPITPIELKPINQSEKPSPPIPLPPKIEEERRNEPTYHETPPTQPINIPPSFEAPYENRDISDVPEYLKFFTQNKCYWELRDKYNFGSYFNPCEICAQPNVYGMWKKACDCCDISYGAKIVWKGA